MSVCRWRQSPLIERCNYIHLRVYQQIQIYFTFKWITFFTHFDIICFPFIQIYTISIKRIASGVLPKVIKYLTVHLFHKIRWWWWWYKSLHTTFMVIIYSRKTQHTVPNTPIHLPFLKAAWTTIKTWWNESPYLVSIKMINMVEIKLICFCTNKTLTKPCFIHRKLHLIEKQLIVPRDVLRYTYTWFGDRVEGEWRVSELRKIANNSPKVDQKRTFSNFTSK